MVEAVAIVDVIRLQQAKIRPVGRPTNFSAQSGPKRFTSGEVGAVVAAFRLCQRSRESELANAPRIDGLLSESRCSNSQHTRKAFTSALKVDRSRVYSMGEVSIHQMQAEHVKGRMGLFLGCSFM